MKTAETWNNILRDKDAPLSKLHPNWIRQIQLDAMKEGMRRAAEICEMPVITPIKQSPETYARWTQCQNSILSAAEQLTEKDL